MESLVSLSWFLSEDVVLLPCKTYIKFLFKAVVRFRGNFTLQSY